VQLAVSALWNMAVRRRPVEVHSIKSLFALFALSAAYFPTSVLIYQVQLVQLGVGQQLLALLNNPASSTRLRGLCALFLAELLTEWSNVLATGLLQDALHAFCSLVSMPSPYLQARAHFPSTAHHSTSLLQPRLHAVALPSGARPLPLDSTSLDLASAASSPCRRPTFRRAPTSPRQHITRPRFCSLVSMPSPYLQARAHFPSLDLASRYCLGQQVCCWVCRGTARPCFGTQGISTLLYRPRIASTRIDSGGVVRRNLGRWGMVGCVCVRIQVHLSSARLD
jgi:hypothetical protein